MSDPEPVIIWRWRRGRLEEDYRGETEDGGWWHEIAGGCFHEIGGIEIVEECEDGDDARA